MARVTVEDCMKKVPNRFALVLLASERARAINCGAPITVERNNDKNTVTALREIAEETVNIEQLKENLITNLQTLNKVDIVKDENLHAESQEILADDLDLSDDSVQLLSHEEFSDLEIGDFEDELIEDNK